MRRKSSDARCAERQLRGVDDAGRDESVVIWVERKEGGVWAVGRAVNPQHRRSDEPQREDYLFEGYELSDALEAANDALEDDARVLEDDGSTESVKPFTRKKSYPSSNDSSSAAADAWAVGSRRAEPGSADLAPLAARGSPSPYLRTVLSGRAPRAARQTPAAEAALGRLFRPLELRVRDRFAVRVVCGEAERLVDPRLELLGEGVLEPVCLLVDIVDGDPERLGEVELE